jgi:hypothetical protein
VKGASIRKDATVNELPYNRTLHGSVAEDLPSPRCTSSSAI